MRKIVFSIGLAVTSACTAGTAVELTDGLPQWGVVTSVTFTRDDRPADGSLVQLILTKNPRGKYDANKRTVTASLSGQSQDTTELLATDLECRNSRSQADSLNSVHCSVDTRPVDGPLIELFFEPRRTAVAATMFNVRMILTPSGFGGDSTPRTTQFGDGFTVTVSN
jgi:hypothetical protein